MKSPFIQYTNLHKAYSRREVLGVESRSIWRRIQVYGATSAASSDTVTGDATRFPVSPRSHVTLFHVRIPKCKWHLALGPRRYTLTILDHLTRQHVCYFNNPSSLEVSHVSDTLGLGLLVYQYLIDRALPVAC